MSMTAWTLEFTRPAWLLLAACVVPIVVYYRRSLVDFPRRQRWVSLLCRCAVIVLLVLAAAGVNLLRSDDRQCVLFLVDRSDSVDSAACDQAARTVSEAIRSKRRSDEARAMTFAGHTLPARDPQQAEEKLDGLERSKTDLADAVSVAWASIPSFYVKKLVVFSDGLQTRGDVLSVVRAAHQAGVQIHTVPLASSNRDEVQLSEVVGPAQVRAGAPFEMQICVTSNHEDAGTLEIYRNDVLVGKESVTLRKGENRFKSRQVASSDKLQTYSVRLQAERDHFVDNNTSSALIACEGKPRVLIIGPEDKVSAIKSQEPYLVRALEHEDIEVDERGPRGVPRTLADMENYDLLVLSNVPATDLDQHQMQLIRAYVQDLGGGLIMLGGDQSFGLGGFYKTVLEEVLPVRSDFEKEKEKPHLAMVLVIDKSGSMGGEKIELAKEAAKGAVELLGAKDQIGVIAFDGEPVWVCELHPAVDRPFVMERISSLTAGGGTNLAPAMADAYLGLQGVSAPLKHVIILTDGQSQPGNFYEISSSMADSKITISTVAVGDGADLELLERIAEWGHGRFYVTNDPTSVPQIFAKETMEASKSAINEQPFVPQQVAPHQICQGLKLDEAPFLLGYVITKVKPTAELVLATEAGHPLLATWRYGLGKSLAFTSDAKNRWAAEWVQWPGFSRFWSQVVRDTMRMTAPAHMQVQMNRVGEEIRVTVDALHPSPQRAGEYLDDVSTTLELIQPGSEPRHIELEQDAPGRYVGRFAVEDTGNYHVRIAQKQQGVEVQATSRGVAVGYSDEYRVASTDESLLRQMAEAGGGLYNPSPQSIFRTDARTRRVQPLWPILLSVALVLLILDIALRRIDFAVMFGASRPWPAAATKA